MATKRKAGKSKKAAVRKPAPRKSTARKAAEQAKVERSFPCKVMVSKGAEKIPVEVKDEAQRQKLVEEFGEANVEALS